MSSIHLSQQLFQDRLLVEKGWEQLDTYSLMEKSGLMHFPAAGLPTYLPLGQRLARNVMNAIHTAVQSNGFSEMYLPLLQDRKLMEESGRYAAHRDEIFHVKERNERFILSGTNEEVFLELAEAGIQSYRQLPARFYQIADKFRNVKKAKGAMRSRQFLMCDMMSLDADKRMQQESIMLFEQAVEQAFGEMNIHAKRIAQQEERYVDFAIPCEEGEISSDGQQYSGVAMYFVDDRAGTTRFQDADGSTREVLTSSYGFGIQRAMHATIHQNLDAMGLILPKNMRLFDASIVVINPESSPQMSEALRLAARISLHDGSVAIDDRQVTFKQKMQFGDFYGIPYKIVIGERELEQGHPTLVKRVGSEDNTDNSALDQLVMNL